MSNLYELTNDYLTVFNMLEDDEIEEQVIIDTLESIEGEIESKADGYAKIIKSLETTVLNIESELSRLNDRKKSYENKIKWLKSNLENSMRETGKLKFTTDLFSFNIQKNGGKRKLIIDKEIEKIPNEFKIKQPDVVNNEKIREFLKQSTLESCEFAHLEPQTESLRIR